MADLAITAELLARAAKRNGYAIPPKGLVFFGIRGLKPELPFENRFSASHTGKFSSIDFRRMNCTLGQWKVDTSEIAVFPGSTVPSLPNIVSAQKNNGTGTNMLMLGRYEHEKGIHKAKKKSGHQAFRQASFFPVWRTVDNLIFDLADKVDLGSGPGDFVWDNIHSAYSDSLDRYSSAGCQVVCGQPRSPDRNNQPETGPWRSFIENAYGTDQNRFVYLLFSHQELALLERTQEVTQLVRFGSSGQAARDVQTALAAKGLLQEKPDGELGRLSLSALMGFQSKFIGPSAADGVCGVETAAMLGIKLPSLTKAKAAPQPSQPIPATGDNPELEDETDLDPDSLRTLLLATFGTLTGTPPAPMITPPADAGQSRANFERAQAIIKVFEGGFSNDPNDPGGPTNFGITHKILAAWRKKKSVTAAEVHDMTYEEAKDIYYAEFWSKSSCGHMPGPLALPVYNIAVHAGPITAMKFLQRALNQNGAVLKIDGDIGDNSRAAIAAAPVQETISDLIDLYEAKLRAHKKFTYYKKGFLKRVSILRMESVKWLADIGAEEPAMPTPKLAEEGESAVTNEELFAELFKRLNVDPAQPGVAPLQPGVAPPGLAAQQDPTAAFVAMLRKAIEGNTGKPALTPVNGALGQTVGKLLDGRKSLIGIVGAVFSALLTPAASAAPGALSPLASILPTALGGILGPLSTVAPVLLPVFLALTAWGGLGKLDKYAAQQK